MLTFKAEPQQNKQRSDETYNVKVRFTYERKVSLKTGATDIVLFSGTNRHDMPIIPKLKAIFGTL